MQPWTVTSPCKCRVVIIKMKDGGYMSYAKLRGKIREVFGTQEAFAAAIGINTVSLSQRLTGKIEWKISEIALSCQVLGIPLEENAEYFFTKEVKIS